MSLIPPCAPVRYAAGSKIGGGTWTLSRLTGLRRPLTPPGGWSPGCGKSTISWPGRPGVHHRAAVLNWPDARRFIELSAAWPPGRCNWIYWRLCEQLFSGPAGADHHGGAAPALGGGQCPVTGARVDGGCLRSRSTRPASGRGERDPQGIAHGDEEKGGRQGQPDKRHLAGRPVRTVNNSHLGHRGAPAHTPHHVAVHRFPGHEDHRGKRDDHRPHGQRDDPLDDRAGMPHPARIGRRRSARAGLARCARASVPVAGDLDHCAVPGGLRVLRDGAAHLLGGR